MVEGTWLWLIGGPHGGGGPAPREPTSSVGGWGRSQWGRAMAVGRLGGVALGMAVRAQRVCRVMPGCLSGSTTHAHPAQPSPVWGGLWPSGARMGCGDQDEGLRDRLTVVVGQGRAPDVRWTS